MIKKILLAIVLLVILPSVTAIENPQPLIKVNFTEPININTLNVNLTNISNHNFSLELQESYDNRVFYYMPGDPLQEGTYILRAQAKDLAGNLGDMLEYIFTIKFKSLSITLVNPRFEHSTDKILDLVVNTTRDAQCKYYLDVDTIPDSLFGEMRQFNSTGTILHTITNFTITKSPQLFYVKCFDSTRNKYESKLFRLLYDTQKPIITEVKLDPNQIFESGDPFNLYVTTNEDTLCKYSLSEKNFSSMQYTFDGFDQFNFKKFHTQSLNFPYLEDGIYNYYVSCIDKAGLTSNYDYAELTVDFQKPFEIIEITAPSYTSEPSVEITVKTNYDASCSINNYDLTTNLKTHYKTFSDLDTGTSVYNISCTRTTTQEKAYDSITITFDGTPPEMIYVREIGYGDESGKTYKTNALKGEWEAEDDESSVTQYNVLLYLDNEYSEDELIDSLITSDTEEEITGLKLNDSETYYFKVSAVNKVGLWSNNETGDGITVDTSLSPASCNNGRKDNNEEDIDCGGVCVKGCSINSSCSKNSDCKNGFCNPDTDKCTAPTCDDGSKNGKESDVDCGGECDEKCGTGNSCGDNDDCKSKNCHVSTGKCVEAGKCYNNKLDANEADVDCGGACLVKCGNGDSCESDYDCKSGNCLDDRCFEPTCSDGMKNQDETDRDCGGSCSPCENDKSCLRDDDCISGKCDNNICAELTIDKDNDGLSNEWENMYNEGDLDPNKYDTDENGISDADEDFDNDGLKNSVEQEYGTDPHKKDTDVDGYTDKEEIDKGTNPLDPDDYPESKILFYIFLFIALILLGIGLFFGFKKFKEMKESKIEIPPIEKKLPEIKPITEPRPKEKIIPKKPAITTGVTPLAIKEKLEKARMEKKKKRESVFEKFSLGEKPIKKIIKKEKAEQKKIEEEEPKLGWVELKVPKKTKEKPKKEIHSIFERLPKIPGEDVFVALSKMVGAVVKEKTVREFTDVQKKRKLTKEELIELINKFSKEKKLDEGNLHKILVSILEEEKKIPIKRKRKEKLPTIVKKETKKRKTTKKKKIKKKN